MSARRVLLLCALSGVWLCCLGQDRTTVCPDNYSPSPSEGCVPLHQLLSTLHLIHSNTTIQLLPAVFKLGSDLRISIANVSNITVGAAGPHRATISCTGSNSGFVFKRVSRLSLENININNCSIKSIPYSHSVAIFDCTNVTLTSVTFTVNGVYAENIDGYFITSNALFTEMVDSTGIGLKESSFREPLVNISNSKFLNGHCARNYICALNIHASSLHLSNISVRGNAIDSDLISLMSSTINLERLRLEDNKLLHSRKRVAKGILIVATEVVVIDCIFSNNDISVMDIETAQRLIINDTIFSRNRDSAMQARIYPSASILYPSEHLYYVVGFHRSIFINNTGADSNYIVYLTLSSFNNVLLQDCTFSNNRKTSLLLSNSFTMFAGINFFSNNSAYDGAAMVLDRSKIVIVEDNATLYIQGNEAERFGGGIYVKKQSEDDVDGPCFLSTAVTVHFDRNIAHFAGNDIYGGNLHVCFQYSSGPPNFQSPTGYKIDVSSSPTRVCACSEQNIATCYNPTKVIATIKTYPGKKFNLSLLAVGQVLSSNFSSGVPSAVYSQILQETTELEYESIPSGVLVQKGLRTCSNLTYSIKSRRENNILALSVGGLTGNEMTQYWLNYPSKSDILNNHKMYSNVPAYVEVHYLPCPAGFNLSLDGACVCSNALKSFDVDCIIDTLTIHRKSPYLWLAVNISSSFFRKFLAHRHCPFDYCKHDTLDFSLADTDALCNHNRSGILCGACRSGYSLILGGTECRQCSNIYLLLLLPFALAGILLVVFLSLTDMTVAAGTINGLLFYANIVTDNKDTFFPPEAEDSFLSVFVQWLSLDLGIKSCFFDGLDAYTFTWIQLVFPVYICLLAFTIIIASRHITWMSRLYGTNIVQVLATLFLLSYTKLQATIASGLSFTVVEVSDGEKLFVWLKDGNVPYLQGKHLALFLISLLLLCVFSLYTLSIALSPWLQRKTQYKVFCWVLKLKPLFDAYFGPLKNQYRYWTGLLLLSRTVLYLVSSANVLGDDSVNLLAIVIVCLFLTWQSRCVYEHRILSALDSFFLMNLCLLALVSLYNKLSSGGSQTVTIYVSSGFAFAVFCATLFYHCFSRLKKAISERKHVAALKDDASAEDESDKELLSAMDSDRNDLAVF